MVVLRGELEYPVRANELYAILGPGTRVLATCPPWCRCDGSLFSRVAQLPRALRACMRARIHLPVQPDVRSALRKALKLWTT